MCDQQTGVALVLRGNDGAAVGAGNLPADFARIGRHGNTRFPGSLSEKLYSPTSTSTCPSLSRPMGLIWHPSLWENSGSSSFLLPTLAVQAPVSTTTSTVPLGPMTGVVEDGCLSQGGVRILQ